MAKAKPITSGMVGSNIAKSYHKEFLENLFKFVCRLPGNPEPDKDGVVVAIWYMKAMVSITALVGNPANKEINDRVRDVLERVSRVLDGNLLHSFQGRNPRKRLLGGGVFNMKLMGACSGFENEHADEVLILIYLIYHNYMEGGIFYKYKKGKATFEEVLVLELEKFQNEVVKIAIVAGKQPKPNPFIKHILKLSEKGPIGLVY